MCLKEEGVGWTGINGRMIFNTIQTIPDDEESPRRSRSALFLLLSCISDETADGFLKFGINKV